MTKKIECRFIEVQENVSVKMKDETFEVAQNLSAIIFERAKALVL